MQMKSTRISKRNFVAGRASGLQYDESLNPSARRANRVFIAAILSLLLFSASHLGLNAQVPGESIASLTARATAGDVKAEYDLGLSYDRGQGVPQDHAQATAWFLKAADQGFAHAQSFIGAHYHAGLGVPQDDRLAAAWFLKAANQGLADAQYDLAVLYSGGKGVPRDLRAGRRLVPQGCRPGIGTCPVRPRHAHPQWPGCAAG
jgi:TPR repeat protein